MTKEERLAYLVELDEELLKGGVILSEWCSVIIREADIAFASGAYLASILTSVSGIETYLRSEYGEKSRERLIDLIEKASLDVELTKDLQTLRQYRNRWVHVDDPWDDKCFLVGSGGEESELQKMAFFAARALRRTIYENPWI